MRLNLKVRLNNPVFWVQVIGAVGITALAYNSMVPQDLTTWAGVGNLAATVIKNPYLVGLCLWNVWSSINDPTTTGVTDSTKALEYDKPNDN